MAYAPVLAQGTTFTFNSVAILGVTGMTGLGSGKAKDIDVTTLASTAKQFLPGLQDFGSFTLDLIRSEDDAGQVAVATALAAQAPHTMVIVLPSGTLKTATCTCYVTSLTTDTAADEKATGKAEFRVTGAIAWS